MSEAVKHGKLVETKINNLTNCVLKQLSYLSQDIYVNFTVFPRIIGGYYDIYLSEVDQTEHLKY